VLDTGIDRQHPDLNVVGGANCLKYSGSFFRRTYYCDASEDGDDDHYHGTHVAGTIGAIDNDTGVVGVAPGVRLWAVKVLDSQGSGSLSGIIAGIDWFVVQNIKKPAVINMSLGGSGTSTAMNTSIANAVAADVAVVVAAGNSDADAANYTPANAPDAITVSALADFDGEPGGLGLPTCRNDQDDTLADFSNWGAVDIAAPGVCILSTYPIERGSYGTISGTSMAAPHVAGAAALLASNGDKPAAIRTTLLHRGNVGWIDDSGDEIPEPLLDVSTFTATFVAGGGGGGGDTNTPPVASFTFSRTDLTCTFTDKSTDDGTIVAWSWNFGDGTPVSTARHPTHEYLAGGTYKVSVTVTDDDDDTNEVSQE
jgi:subtilisin